MNRKILVVLVLVAALLAAPFVGLAQAGKGQGREDFLFVLIGTYGGEAGYVKEAGKSTHLADLPFINLAPLVVKIGGVPIDPALLSYSGSMLLTTVDNPNGRGAETIKVTETITIQGEGTLELKVMGNIEQGEGVGAGDNFIGFGTGDLAGVKISGSTPGGPVEIGEYTVPGTDPPIVIPVYQLTRIGKVMGWPT